MANYANTASVAQLGANMDTITTTLTVAGGTFTGWPAAQCWGIIARGTASAELVLVTAIAGANLTVTRAQGGTAASNHNTGDTFEHVVPAAHFYDAELHQVSSSGVHGVAGSVVGTTDAQTLSNKTYRGAHTSVYSDATPAGVTASYLSTADNAGGRDGFVQANTAGHVDRRGFLLTQSGTDRFQVFHDGTVDINNSASARPGLRVRTTTQLDGNVTAGADLSVGDDLTVTGDLGVTGPTTVTSLAASGNVTVGGTLDVTGTTTLGTTNTGVLTASGAISGTTVTGSGAVTGNSLVSTTTITGASATLSGAVSAGSVAATGASTSFGGGRPLLTVSALANITSPANDDLAQLQSDNMIYRWNGSAWIAVHAAGGAGASDRHRFKYRQTGTAQSIADAVQTRVSFNTTDYSTTDWTTSTVSGGTVFTCAKDGAWLIVVNYRLGGAGAGERALTVALEGDPNTIYGIASAGTSGTFPWSASVTVDRDFSVGNAFTVYAYQDTTGAVDVGYAEITCRFMGMKAT